ncbi:unnamed protein product [Calicophoron daubneyi]|uniref:Uncharacterized protein n=1 Tax=Calicophoron daubneyi TaxID=300641 RepID=A0AAV2TVT8_CALDB
MNSRELANRAGTRDQVLKMTTNPNRRLETATGRLPNLPACQPDGGQTTVRALAISWLVSQSVSLDPFPDRLVERPISAQPIIHARQMPTLDKWYRVEEEEAEEIVNEHISR